MKKIAIITLLMVIGVIRVSAQEVDLSQENSSDARIEELSQKVADLSNRLEQLQEDYDYLNFENLLQNEISEAKIFILDVRISTSKVMDLCNSSFDIDIYLAVEETYNLEQERYNQLVDYKDDLFELIPYLTFSNERLDYINHLYSKLDFHIATIEKYFQLYKDSIDLYKEKGKGYRF